MHNTSLETEVTKGFLVSLQLRAIVLKRTGSEEWSQPEQRKPVWYTLCPIQKHVADNLPLSPEDQSPFLYHVCMC